MKRFKTIVCIGAIALVILLGGGILWKDRWLSIPASEGIGIHLTIKNLTNQEIGPFVISDALGSSALRIVPLEPESTIAVDFITPEVWGENAIVLSDTTGQHYTIVGYFEHNINGRVDIIVECASSNGLSGRRREITSFYFSLDWVRWGIPDCELPLE